MTLNSWLQSKIQRKFLEIASLSFVVIIFFYSAFSYLYFKKRYDDFLSNNNRLILSALQTGDIVSLRKTFDYLFVDEQIFYLNVQDSFHNSIISKDAETNLPHKLKNFLAFDLTKQITGRNGDIFGFVVGKWHMPFTTLLYGLLFLALIFTSFYALVYKHLIEIAGKLSKTIQGLPSLVETGEPDQLFSEIYELNQVFVKLKVSQENIILNEQLNAQLARQKEIYNLSHKVAHDIRTPISTLNLISSKIQDENIKTLHQSVVQRINAIADDMLKFAKGRPIEFNNIRTTTVISFSSLLEKEYEISQFSDQINIKVASNVSSLEMENIDILYPIVKNFITNAIEATENLNRKIEVFFEKHESDDRKIIKIKDNGKGIPNDILVKLGSTPVSYGKNNSFSGSGIAIFNAKNDLDKIHAKLIIDSSPDSGTCFTISTIKY